MVVSSSCRPTPLEQVAVFFAKFVGMPDTTKIGALIRSGEIRSLRDIFKHVAHAEIADRVGMPPRLLVRQFLQ